MKAAEHSRKQLEHLRKANKLFRDHFKVARQCESLYIHRKESAKMRDKKDFNPYGLLVIVVCVVVFAWIVTNVHPADGGLLDVLKTR